MRVSHFGKINARQRRYEVRTCESLSGIYVYVFILCCFSLNRATELRCKHVISYHGMVHSATYAFEDGRYYFNCPIFGCTGKWTSNVDKNEWAEATEFRTRATQLLASDALNPPVKPNDNVIDLTDL